jgi:hypothetical protein
MLRPLWLAILGLTILGLTIAALPSSAQEREGPRTPSGEIRIPSGAAIDRMLDENTVPNPAKDFSSNDAIAIQQMDERAKKIDREVEKGICQDC